MSFHPAPRDLRASDSDRDRVISMLGDAVADGRLTAAEHGDRVERAYQARTLGELATLTTDLAGPAGQPIRLDARKGIAGIFSRDSRHGHWVVPPSLPVLAIFGEVELDLREAVLQAGRTVIFASILAGTLHLIVPDGVAVQTTGTTLLTRKISRSVRLPGYGQPGPSQPGAPVAVIEIRTFAIGGTIKVTSPRRSRWLGGLRRGSLPR